MQMLVKCIQPESFLHIYVFFQSEKVGCDPANDLEAKFTRLKDNFYSLWKTSKSEIEQLKSQQIDRK